MIGLTMSLDFEVFAGALDRTIGSHFDHMLDSR
jgi:hypothetical protein